jgi:hypothetical protein
METNRLLCSLLPIGYISVLCAAMRSFLIVLLFIVLTGCDNINFGCEGSFYHEYFYSSFDNISTNPRFVVVKVQDKRTGQKKEICCKSDDLSNAILDEYGSDLIDSLKIAKPCKFTFGITNPKNLHALNFYNYDHQVLDSLRNRVPKRVFDSIRILPALRSYRKIWLYTDKLEGNYFEHLMIENGIGCKRDDETGRTLPLRAK